MPGEFELIENLKNRYGLDRIGDDCAVLPKDGETDLVVTADLLVEDVDFRLEWTRADFVGHKALAVSLSDVAAMGARPVWALVSLGVPERLWKTGFVERFYEGWFELARRFGVELVGGDVSRTPDKFVVDSTVAGEIEKGRAILRSGAKAGDLLCVTGSLGGAAAALELLEKGERYGRSAHDSLLLRQLAPTPQVTIGRLLGERSRATAMIDLSDGLSSDLRHLCEASGVGAIVFRERVPVDENLRDATAAFGILNRDRTAGDLFSLALDGGEDFELLFAVAPKKISELADGLPQGSFSVIGELTANTEIIELIEANKTRPLTPAGFRHF